MMLFEGLRLHASYTRTSLTKIHKLLVAFIFIVFFLFLYKPNPTVTFRKQTTKFTPEIPRNITKRPRFAKVTVASGFEDILYERALDTHILHAKRYGYPMYIARENVADGMFNKIAYILHVLLYELFMPADERVEWLFYSDADTIIVNQNIPLEIFEPPSDFSDIHWLAGKDQNGLNAGAFLLRVNQWSLNLLSRTMTYKLYHPKEDYTFEEQSVLARLTEGADEFKCGSIYVPRTWFNAYRHEVKPGQLLCHFPAPENKWHISTWLRFLKSKPGYDRPLAETSYLEEIKKFWEVKRRVDKAIKGFDRNVNRGADPVLFGMQHDETRVLAEDFKSWFEKLRIGASQMTDDANRLEEMIDKAEEANAKLIEALMQYFETHNDRPPIAGF